MNTTTYQTFRTKGFILAGGLGDLNQRACVYRHLYEDSGKRNVFPLIAAHGALWAAGYFKAGMLGGRLMSLPFLARPGLRDEKLAGLAAFADKFRDINRRVCAESYALYHYSKQFTCADDYRVLAGSALAEALAACHASYRADQAFSQAQRAALFHAFFSWEQKFIVAPAVEEAFAALDWKVIKYLARKPTIDFAYFGSGYKLAFCDFADTGERIARGMQAYQRAESVGLDKVESSLSAYRLMPDQFHTDPNGLYRSIELACT